MSTGLHQIFAIAAELKCWRQEMRQKTRPILALTPLLTGLQGLRTKIPPALLGQDLVALLSRQLQGALLGQWVESSAGSPHSTRRRPNPLDINGSLLPAPEPYAARSSGTSAAPGETSRIASDDPKESKWTDLINPSVPQNLTPLQASENLKEPREPGEEPYPCRPVTSRLAPSGQNEPQSAVVPSLPPFQGACPPSWPELFGRQMVKKLQQLDKPGVYQTPGNESTQQHDRVEIHNVFQVSLNNGLGQFGSSPTSLAETLADILREQALHHGIDVT
jgi:hypothetical protein